MYIIDIILFIVTVTIKIKLLIIIHTTIWYCSILTKSNIDSLLNTPPLKTPFENCPLYPPKNYRPDFFFPKSPSDKKSHTSQQSAARHSCKVINGQSAAVTPLPWASKNRPEKAARCIMHAARSENSRASRLRRIQPGEFAPSAQTSL